MPTALADKPQAAATEKAVAVVDIQTLARFWREQAFRAEEKAPSLPGDDAREMRLRAFMFKAAAVELDKLVAKAK